MSMHTGTRCLIFISNLMFGAAFLSPGLAAAEEGTVTVTIPAGPYVLQSTPEGLRPAMEGFGRLLVPGKPDLPTRIFAVAVPPGAKILSVDFEPGGEVVLPGRYGIPPCPMPRVTGEENPALYERDRKRFEANRAAVYGSDEAYPAAVGEFLGQGGYRKYNLADVRISPFTYHPLSGRLAYHPEVAVRIAYRLPERLPDDVVLEDRHPRTEHFARNILYNYGQAQAWYPKGTTSGGPGLHDFVIITLSSLTKAVQPLVDWEEAKGRTVKVVPLSWISYNYPGYDLQEKMRNFLRDKWPAPAWGIRDVLFVGHYDDVPMRRVAQDVGYGQPETDFYYAELSLPDHQSWDKDGDRQWGEDEDPNDFFAEVNVGRIPWSDPDTVRHICVKSAGFENNNDPAFKKNILLLGSFFWDDTDNAILMELKTDPALNPWMDGWTRMRLYEKNSEYASGYPCDFPLHNRNAVEQWRKGRYAFVNWAGHGNPYGCHMLGMSAGYFIGGSDSTCLNDRYPSIVAANACSNSDTDDTNIGQLMLRQGAVGFLGATKVSFGYHGWNHPYGGCGSSMDYWFTHYTTSAESSQGEGLQQALQLMYTYNLFYYVKYEMFEWSSLFGNPDLTLALRAPLTVCGPEGIPNDMALPGGETRMTIEIRSGLEHYVPASGLLHYRFDPGDAFSTVNLKHLGEGVFEAVLPATKPGDRPEFYFSAEGDGGSLVTAPYEAPLDLFSFEVGYRDVLSLDGFETESGWTVENVAIENGEWERADPGETCVQPDDDHSPDGTLCFVTGKEGGSIGYDDLDGGPTHLVSPVLDLSQGDPDIGFYLWVHQSCYGVQQPFEIGVSNDGGSSWIPVTSFMHLPGWNLLTFRVSDHVTPNASVKVRFTAIDNPNDACVEALLDDFMVLRILEAPPLWATPHAIPLYPGGAADFHLEAGADHAGRPYLLLGSVSGTAPGMTLPGGAVLPLNFDAFTGIVLAALGTPMFKEFMGNLDGSGQAKAVLDTLGSVDPSLAGQQLYFAYLLGPAPYFASNAIVLTLQG